MSADFERDTGRFPSNAELRRWAMERRPDLVMSLGALPRFVVIAWDREHPERPFVKNEAHHGTINGYTRYDCRCGRCSAVHAAYQREMHEQRKTERDECLADELQGES